MTISASPAIIIPAYLFSLASPHTTLCRRGKIGRLMNMPFAQHFARMYVETVLRTNCVKLNEASLRSTLFCRLHANSGPSRMIFLGRMTCHAPKHATASGMSYLCNRVNRLLYRPRLCRYKGVYLWGESGVGYRVRLDVTTYYIRDRIDQPVQTNFTFFFKFGFTRWECILLRSF